MLASLANGPGGKEDGEEEDPSNMDHLSDSSDSSDDGNNDDAEVEATSSQKDCPSGLFGEAPESAPSGRNTTYAGENRHQRKLRLVWDEIKGLKGTKIDSGTGAEKITWEVVESCEDDEIGPQVENVGIKPEFNFGKMTLAEAFMLLWPGDFWTQHRIMVNHIINVVNPNRNKIGKRIFNPPTRSETVTFLSLMIAACQHTAKGMNLFGGRKDKTRKNKVRRLSKTPDFSVFMQWWRFQQMKKMMEFMMLEGDEKDDDWYKVRGFINGLNSKRLKVLLTSAIHVLDESMSSFWPR